MRETAAHDSRSRASAHPSNDDIALATAGALAAAFAGLAARRCRVVTRSQRRRPRHRPGSATAKRSAPPLVPAENAAHAAPPRRPAGADTVAARRRLRRDVSISFRALGTTVVIATVDRRWRVTQVPVATAELDAIDRACSRFRSDSELTRVNRRSRKCVARSARCCSKRCGRARRCTRERRPRRPDSGPHAAHARLRLDISGRRGARRDTFHARTATVPGWQSVELDGTLQPCASPKASSSTSAQPPRRSPATAQPLPPPRSPAERS